MRIGEIWINKENGIEVEILKFIKSGETFQEYRKFLKDINSGFYEDGDYFIEFLEIKHNMKLIYPRELFLFFYMPKE